MSFHRLVAPVYFSPPSFDYMNNGGSGTPALFDGPRPSGPNAGTYLVGFGEDARNAAFNRGLVALAENCDALDDFVHRSAALQRVTSDIVSDGTVTAIVLTGPVFIGDAGTPNTAEGIRSFVQVVDSEDVEIFNGNTEVTVSSITGGTPGGVWSAGDITLNLSAAIPLGTTYRVYYSIRGSAAVVLPSDLVTQRRYGRYNGGPNWVDGTTNPATTINRQIDKIISDLSSTVSGSSKVGSPEINPPGSTYWVSEGVVATQILEIVTALNLIQADITALDAAYTALLLDFTNHVGDVYRVRTLTSSATMNSPSLDSTIILNPSGGAFNLQLPNPATKAGQKVALINGDGTMSSTNKVTLVRNGSEKINNLAANFELIAPYGRWILASDGVDWHLI